MTSYHNPFTRSYYVAAAHAAFGLVSFGATPSDKDEPYIHLLADELQRNHNPFAGELLMRRTQDEGLPLCTVSDSRNDWRADCWIEDCHRPTAFFYWES